MNSGLGTAIIGLAWAAALGPPLLTIALLLWWSEGPPNAQLIGLCTLATCIGGWLALRASQRIRDTVKDTRAHVLAELRSAASPAEARKAAGIAAVFAGDPSYAREIETLSDHDVLRLCKEILQRNEPVGRRRA